MNRFIITSLLLCLALVCLCTAEIRPAVYFNASEDALTLANALKSSENLGSITDLLTSRSAKQRQEIGKILVRQGNSSPGTVLDFFRCRLESEPEYRNLVLALLTPLDEFYANEMLLDTMPGKGYTGALVDVITTWPKKVLTNAYGGHMRLGPELLNSNYLTRRVIDGTLGGKRSEEWKVNQAAANADARMIHYVSYNVTRRDRTPQQNDLVEDIFITRSYNQLRQIFKAYDKLYNNWIGYAFQGTRWSPQLQRSFETMIPPITSVSRYYARNLHDALTENRTRELTRTIVGRSEIDLREIELAFRQTYGKLLSSEIEESTSGEYTRALSAILYYKNH